MNDILEGYYRKLKRENDILIFQAKIARKAAFINAYGSQHFKGLTENKFNTQIWPIDEVVPDEDEELKERVKRMQEGVKKFNIKMSEARRKKQKK